MRANVIVLSAWSLLPSDSRSVSPNVPATECIYYYATQGYSEDVLLVEFMYLVFTRMPGESYRRRVGTLLFCLCDVVRALINSLVLILHERFWPRTVGREATYCQTIKCFPTSVHTVILSSLSPPLYILSYYQVFPHLCTYCHTITCFPTSVHTVILSSLSHFCTYCHNIKCFPTSVPTVTLSSVSPPLYILSYYQVFPHLCTYCHTIK